MPPRLSGILFNIRVEILTSFDWVAFLIISSDTRVMGCFVDHYMLRFKREVLHGNGLIEV